MNYEDQLNTSAWMRRKYDILKRDNFVCNNCLCDNYERKLDVHHIAYIKNRKAWDYPDYLLVTLCRDCHKKEHDEKNILKTKKIIQWIVKLLEPKQKLNVEINYIKEKKSP